MLLELILLNKITFGYIDFMNIRFNFANEYNICIGSLNLFSLIHHFYI